jgi:hypothetical protein
MHLIYRKDDFTFPIVNFPFICSNIPAAPWPAYGVYVLQLKRYVTHRKKSMCKGKDASTSDKIDISYKGEPVSDVHRRIFVSTQPSSNVALFESL